VIVPKRHPLRIEMRYPFGGNRVSFDTSGHDCRFESIVFG
jgi:hypothetical protein